MRAVILSFTLLGLAAAAPSVVTFQKNLPWKKPAFCGSIDCPPYTELRKTKDYEVRWYNVTAWVSTSEKGVDFEKASHDEFMRLFHYISGENLKKEKIAMTAPVLITITPGPGPACESNFNMSFYVSPSAGRPPMPTDPTVYLHEMKGMTVFVRSFGGHAKLDDWLSEARELGEKLPPSAKYIKDYFITAGYDSPFKLFNRHNEVWFIAEP